MDRDSKKDKVSETAQGSKSGLAPCYTSSVCNDMPWHLYECAVVKELQDVHGVYGSCGWKLYRKYKNMASSYYNHGHSYRECAFDIHWEWLHDEPKFKRPTLSDHLKSGVYLGIHKV